MRVPGRRPTLRTIFGKLHLWVGLPLGILLALIGITGSLLMVERPLQRLFDPALFADAANGAPRPLHDIVAAAQAAAPGGRVAAIVLSQKGGPAIVRFSPAASQGEGGRREGGRREGGRPEGGRPEGGRPEGIRPEGGRPENARPENGPGGGAERPAPPAGPPGMGGTEIFIDPVTLRVNGTRAAFSGPLGWVHQLHANLFVPGRDGRAIVGWLGILMVGLALSGLYLWWPKGQWRSGRWRRSFLVARGAKGYRLNRELHGAVGIWGFVVFVVVSATGIVLAFPATSFDIVSSAVTTRDTRAEMQAARVTPQAGVEPAGIDEIAALASAAAGNGGALRMLMLPQQPIQPARVFFTTPDGNATVLVDPIARRILQMATPATSTPGERALLWMRRLHEGEGLGSVWTVLVFVSGILPGLFTVTGTTMWLLRRRNRARASGPRGRAEPSRAGSAADPVERTS